MKTIVDQMLEKWDYEKAVNELKPKYMDLSKRTLEVARALYVAREALSSPGFRTDLTSAQMSLGSKDVTLCKIAQGSEQMSDFATHTFDQFCEEVGVSRRTAYSWISCYDPEEDKLYEPDKVKELLQEEKDKLFELVEKKRETESGWIPESITLKWNRKITKWNEDVETEFQQWRYQHGYLPVDPNLHAVAQQKVLESNKYGEFGLWSTEYLDNLVKKCADETSGLKATNYFNMVLRYRDQVPKQVPEREIMRLPVIVKAAITELPKNAQKDSATLVARIIADIAEEL